MSIIPTRQEAHALTPTSNVLDHERIPETALWPEATVFASAMDVHKRTTDVDTNLRVGRGDH